MSTAKIFATVMTSGCATNADGSGAYLGENFLALNDLHAGALHLLDSVRNVVWLEVNSPAGICEEKCFETELHSIQRREFDAVVSRQATNENFGCALLLEPFAHAGRFAMAVVEHPAVTVDARVGAFLKDPGDAI